MSKRRGIGFLIFLAAIPLVAADLIVYLWLGSDYPFGDMRHLYLWLGWSTFTPNDWWPDIINHWFAYFMSLPIWAVMMALGFIIAFYKPGPGGD